MHPCPSYLCSKSTAKANCCLWFGFRLALTIVKYWWQITRLSACAEWNKDHTDRSALMRPDIRCQPRERETTAAGTVSVTEQVMGMCNKCPIWWPQVKAQSRVTLEQWCMVACTWMQACTHALLRSFTGNCVTEIVSDMQRGTEWNIFLSHNIWLCKLFYSDSFCASVHSRWTVQKIPLCLFIVTVVVM